MKLLPMIVDIVTYTSCLLACLYFIGEIREANRANAEMAAKVANEKLILINDGAYRCNKLLSDVGAKPRGEK